MMQRSLSVVDAVLGKRQKIPKLQRSFSLVGEVWEQRQKSVPYSNKYMFKTKEESDVTFVIQYSKEEKTVRVPAHKYVLYSRSPVFHAMFCGSMPLYADDIEITDIPADTFTEILRFIYCDEVHVTVDNVMFMLYGAKKYLLTPLIEKCQQFLEDAINESEVCTILEQSLILSEEDLTMKCLKFIQEETESVVQSPTFAGTKPETLQVILDQNELNIREVDLFKYCVEWAMKNCEGEDASLREVLGDLVEFIRFPTMSIDEFANIVVPLDVLTTDETSMIYKYFTCSVKPDIQFSTINRSSTTPKLVLSRQYQPMEVIHGQEFKVKITINKPSFELRAVHFFLEDASSDTKLQILDVNLTNGWNVIASENGSGIPCFKGLEESSIFQYGRFKYNVGRLPLSNSVMLNGGVSYTLSWTVSCRDSLRVASRKPRLMRSFSYPAQEVFDGSTLAGSTLAGFHDRFKGQSNPQIHVTSVEQRASPLYALEYANRHTK